QGDLGLLGQLAYRRVVAPQGLQDAESRGVGQGGERLVNRRLILNHLVQYAAARHPCQEGATRLRQLAWWTMIGVIARTGDVWYASSRTPSTSRLTTRPQGLLPIDSRVFAPTASSALHEQQDDAGGLRMLGALAFRRGDFEERIALERPVSLLVYLAMRGSWVDRRELAVLYRPDAAEDTALAYLRKLIHRARLYPFASGLEVQRDAVRWLVDSDARRFRDAVDAGDWLTALAAYGGPFLGGAAMPGAPGFSAWQEVEREALESA